MSTRRMVGQMVMTLTIALVLVGSGISGAAAGKKLSDFGSKAEFKYQCELAGGTFSEDGLGNLECHYENGSWTECDETGRDCWYTPPKAEKPGIGVPDLVDNSGLGATDPTPGVPGSVNEADASPSLEAPDDHQDQAASPSLVTPDDSQGQDASQGKTKKGKHGKHGKKGGKGRKN